MKAVYALLEQTLLHQLLLSVCIPACVGVNEVYSGPNGMMAFRWHDDEMKA